VLVHLSYRREAGSASRGASGLEGGDAEDGDDLSGTITGTDEHPFWSLTRGGWIAMGELKPGERLLLADGEATVTAARIEQLAEPVTVYNFEVADWHTYHVGSQEAGWVFVHNTCAEELRRMNLLGWSKGKEAGHFSRHGAGMGFKSGREYTAAARQFARSTSGEVVKVGQNAYFKYDGATNSVLIVVNRRIKTYYTANKGRRSFLEAIAKHRQVLRKQGAPYGVQRGTGNGAVIR